MLALIALVIFVIDAVGGTFGNVDMTALGLAFVAAHLLIGPWPFAGTPPWVRH